MRFATIAFDDVCDACPRWTVRVSATVPTTALTASRAAKTMASVRDIRASFRVRELASP